MSDRRIVVREVTGEREVFRADGAKLREAIEAIWSDSETIALDFESRRVASASFFDECFGMLALQHPVATLQSKLRPANLIAADRHLLNSVIERRARERLAAVQDTAAPGG